MEPISAEQFRARLTSLCSRSAIHGLPRRPRDRLILLESVALTLAPDRAYSAPELTERLEHWLTGVGRNIDIDHVSLRRRLVDLGFLERDAAGRHYRLRRAGPRAGDFAPEVRTTDVERLARDARAQVEERRRAHRG
jgi:hypothetical protein